MTLTYDDEHLPERGSLNYSHFQAFMKRVRSKLGPTRFFACGEYGEDLGRPHFHAVLFGLAFRHDRYRWRRSGSGHFLYRSPTLEKLWPMGSSEFGDLTQQSAAYVARYNFKKVTGALAEDHYRRVDEDTGEVYSLQPEMLRMSLKPGIGARWFQKYKGDVFPHDRVVYKGVEGKPPRYYDVLQERSDPELIEQVREARAVLAAKGAADNTSERLSVREQVTQARVSLFKRK